MGNVQETYITKLSENSISRKFVFRPDIYRIGKSGNREPADLVWVCNNVLVLFYMQETKDQDFDRCTGHNLNQAKGWFHRWKLGQILIGHNRFQSFSIPYGEYIHTVVVSIVKSAKDLAIFHFDFEENLNVDICVTLPESAMFTISSMDAGLADFLYILSLLRSGSSDDGRMPDLMEILLHYFSATLKNADQDNLLQKIDISKGILETFNILLGHKFWAENDFAISKLFNDLLLLDLYRLAIEVKQKMDMIDNDKSNVVFETLPLSYYTIVFCIAPSVGGLSSIINRFIEYADEIVKSGKRVIVMNIELQSGTEMLVPLYSGPSYSETILQNKAPRRVLPS